MMMCIVFYHYTVKVKGIFDFTKEKSKMIQMVYTWLNLTLLIIS